MNIQGGGGGRGGPGGGGGGGARGGAPGGGRAGGAPGGAAPAGNPYTLVDTTIQGAMEKPEGALFDGIDVSLTGLARFAGASRPAALTTALANISANAVKA